MAELKNRPPRWACIGFQLLAVLIGAMPFFVYLYWVIESLTGSMQLYATVGLIPVAGLTALLGLGILAVFEQVFNFDHRELVNSQS